MIKDNQNIALINTEKVSSHLRDKAIDISGRRILITNFTGSEQEKDLSEPSNCKGFGRIHHFKLETGTDWMSNPLPILPAAKALGLNADSQIRAQVFQSSVCNWRCWYCFVDYKLLNGDSRYSSFLSCDEMVDSYLKEENPPLIIDLTGGQPDLTPEWVPWMMETLQNKGLDKKIFLWSDDNLSNDYLWKYLSNEQIDLMSSYKMYSRVCCFKGIDERSFSLNTKASPKLFAYQFDLCKRLLEINLDLYCYITLTANSDTNFRMAIPKFMDAVQAIDEILPLRIVPLKIYEFSPVVLRMNDGFSDMMKGQYKAMEIWKSELVKRFSKEQLIKPITEIELKKH
ncbi:MAG: putative Fe-S oxidoreductase [Segetibacter sp.]|nr:putative Fe-S oxidoreductase [Segetibacter sp.]